MAHTYQAHRKAIGQRRIPMAKSRKVSLFEREIRIRLSQAATEILFSKASILSEGQGKDEWYFGSTMMTIDLEKIAHIVSDSCDAATAKRILNLCKSDKRFCAAAKILAISEAKRVSSVELAEPQVDFRFRRSGQHIYIDMDVEASTKKYLRTRKSRK